MEIIEFRLNTINLDIGKYMRSGGIELGTLRMTGGRAGTAPHGREWKEDLSHRAVIIKAAVYDA